MSNARTAERTNRILILGTSELTEIIVEELDSSIPVLIVSQSGAERIELNREYDVLEGDPGRRETVEEAGIHAASAVITAAESDSQDAMSILTARKIDPSIRIVAAASSAANVSKLKRSGADVVISPHTLGGKLMVKSVLSEDDDEAANVLAELS